MNSKQLREERAKLAATIRQMADKINAESRDFTPEEQEGWKKVNDDYNAMTRRIEVLERADAIGEEMRAPTGDPALGRTPAPKGSDGAALTEANYDRLWSLAIHGWCRAQMDGDATEEQLEAARLVGIKPNAKVLNFSLLNTQDYAALQRKFLGVHTTRQLELGETRLPGFGATLSGQVGSTGGYLVTPETLLRALEINMLWYGGMRQVAQMIRTTTGERISWPTANDTFNTGIQLGESQAAMPPGVASVDPTFGKVYWDAYKFSSQPVLVPYELLEDSVFNLPQVLGQLLGIRLGRITNTKYTLGTGAATPKGIITAAASFAAASPSAIAADDLIGLIHSIDPAYRVPGCGFMMNDAILLALRKLKDGTGQYLWQSGLQQGVPDRLLSYQLQINQDMVNTIASGNKTVLFGLLSNYKIRGVNNMRLYRLQERYRDTDQDGFVAMIREDGNLLDAGTKPVKFLQH